jgi:hypothetical protein
LNSVNLKEISQKLWRWEGYKFWLRERFLLPPLFVLGFVSRFYPLLQFPRVGYDPLLHFEFSQALLQGETSIVVVSQLGEHVTVYYPPLFHLFSLVFFLALPAVDPYLIMKVIVAVFDSLQLFPIYFIVKEVSKSRTGALVAAFISVVTPGDFNMVSWGGYANIAGLVLIALLAYVVIKERPLAVGLVSTVLFLTHHLSMLLAVALFLPYFLVVWRKTRILPKSLIAFLGAGLVAFAAFYWYSLIPLFLMYTTYATRYGEFVLPANWPDLFGFPLLIGAVAGIAMWVRSTEARFAKSDLLLYVWFLLPLLLSYTYLLGIQWDTVRLIYYLQQPACVWAGMAVAHFKNRRWIVVIILLVFVLQWIGTMQVYNSEIWANAHYSY